jgi:hypothetical protein
MSHGKVIEHGSPRELKENVNSAYRKFIEAQKLHDEQETEESKANAGPDYGRREYNKEAVGTNVRGYDIEKGVPETVDLSSPTKDYSVVYLLRRISSLNTGTLQSYVWATLGMLFVILTLLSQFNNPNTTRRHRLRRGIPSVWNSDRTSPSELHLEYW